MSVELEPNELAFQRPFNREVVQKLYIRNQNHDPVAFKVKTTAPKQYCVRPNSGRIEAGREVEVQVLLQAMKEDPPPDFKCRDKFLVQSVAITADQEFSNVAQIWQHVEKGNKSLIMEKKIRVQYLSPSNAPHPQMEAEQHRSPSPPPSYIPSSSADAVKKEDTHEVSPALRASSPKESGSASKPLPDQLADAQARIAELTAQLQNPELRQRKVAEIKEDVKEKASSAMATARAQRTEGVPVQLAAALCLAAFLLAYFFF